MSNKDTYKNSELDRAKPKHSFYACIRKTFFHKADTTGLVEDGTSSSTVVRIIVGLILLHLIVIGGVLLRSHIVKNDSGVAAATGITPPPPAPAQEILPQRATAPQAAPAAGTNHITQAEDDVVAIEDPEPAVAEPAAPVPAANTVKVPHRVATGDTLTKIARQYGVTVAAIQAANPQCKNPRSLTAGTYLNIPVAANSEAAKKAASSAIIPTAPPAKVYIVQKGDSMGKIARKNKISLQKLYKLNGMSDKNNRIQPGQKIIVAE